MTVWDDTSIQDSSNYSGCTLLACYFWCLQHGRTSILHEFWSHRLGLELPKATRSSSAPTARGAESGRDNRPGTMNISRRTPLGEGGILQCLNGILHGFTFGPLCKNINLPIVLIASTNDVLDSSATTEVSGCKRVTNAFVAPSQQEQNALVTGGFRYYVMCTLPD